MKQFGGAGRCQIATSWLCISHLQHVAMDKRKFLCLARIVESITKRGLSVFSNTINMRQAHDE